MQVELQLEGGMPFLEGERGAPKEPEIALEEILAHDFVDALVLHLLMGGEEHPHSRHRFGPLRYPNRLAGLYRKFLSTAKNSPSAASAMRMPPPPASSKS